MQTSPPAHLDQVPEGDRGECLHGLPCPVLRRYVLAEEQQNWPSVVPAARDESDVDGKIEQHEAQRREPALYAEVGGTCRRADPMGCHAW